MYKNIVNLGTLCREKLGYQKEIINQIKLKKMLVIKKKNPLESVEKKLGFSSKKKESSNVVLEIDGETCFGPKKVANCFNKFFTTVGSNLVDY